MLDQDKRSAILLLHQQGHSVRKIARDVQVSRNSVREVLRSGQSQVPAVERATVLDPHLDTIRALYAKCRGNLVRVREELALQHRVLTAYTTLTRFCRKNRIRHTEPARTVRIVTGPGEEMQHDTSLYTIELGGRPVKRHCASLVLGYSRRFYMRFYPRFDRFACKCFLTEALRYMGGACGRCVIDNSSVVLACGAGVSAQVAPEMEAFEKRFGFRFLAHELGHANRKGKIERNYDFVFKNFLAGRDFKDDADLNRKALDWLDSKANVRRIRELGASPQELFAAEATHLVPLPLYIPEVYCLHRREVDAYGDIHLHDRMYSTPPTTSPGKELGVRETEKEVLLLDGHTEVARHPNLTYSSTRHESVLPGHERPRRHHKVPEGESPEELALCALGEPAGAYLQALKTERPGRAYRWGVKILHRLIGHYPGSEIARAMGQALEHRLWEVRRIEAVLLQNLAQDHYQLPLLAEEYESNPEFEKGAATPPPDLSVFEEPPPETSPDNVPEEPSC